MDLLIRSWKHLLYESCEFHIRTHIHTVHTFPAVMQVSTLNNRIQPVDDFNQEKGYYDVNADLLTLFHNSIILKRICLTEPKQRNREVNLGLFFYNG